MSFEVWQFPTNHIGQTVRFYPEATSTNDLAAVVTTTEILPGMGFVAGVQTAGRGQYGRHWWSRPGDSLLVSILLQPPPEMLRPVLLTAWAALAVSRLVRTLSGKQSRIKWPNDVLVDEKKLCGILIEQSQAVIVGIGLNLNQTAKEFAGAGLNGTSMRELLQSEKLEIHDSLGRLLYHLDEVYAALLMPDRSEVEAEWVESMQFLGQLVQLQTTTGEVFVGRVRSQTFDGLELETGAIIPQVFRPEAIRSILKL
ncbi:MAG: biotin--[acetyl-CoA-carboxylase] ligase [Fimbriiglobus sp.]